MTGKSPAELIKALQQDRTIWAQAPCGHEYRLCDSELFYGADLTPAGKKFRVSLQEELIKTREQLKKQRYQVTEGFTKKSVEIKLGKTVEKIAAALPGFPYVPSDCRAIFDPIDYIAFMGLGRGVVNRIDFVDVKSGQSRLVQVQRQIRDIVNDGKVRIRRLG